MMEGEKNGVNGKGDGGDGGEGNGGRKAQVRRSVGRMKKVLGLGGGIDGPGRGEE